jgi:hypothetical protein
VGAVLWAVAGDVEGGVAGAVFGEFVAPEVLVGAALVDPESEGGRECEFMDLRAGNDGVGRDTRERRLTCSCMLASRTSQMVLRRSRCWVRYMEGRACRLAGHL